MREGGFFSPEMVKVIDKVVISAEEKQLVKLIDCDETPNEQVVVENEAVDKAGEDRVMVAGKTIVIDPPIGILSFKVKAKPYEVLS